MQNKPNVVKATSSDFRVQSDFSMGSLDFERFHSLLREADELAILVKSRTQESLDLLPAYHAVLHQLYMNWLGLLNHNIIKVLDRNFEICEQLIEEFHVYRASVHEDIIPANLIKNLVDLHKQLLLIKQYVGLGIVVHKKESMHKTLERVLLGKE